MDPDNAFWMMMGALAAGDGHGHHFPSTGRTIHHTHRPNSTPHFHPLEGSLDCVLESGKHLWEQGLVVHHTRSLLRRVDGVAWEAWDIEPKLRAETQRWRALPWQERVPPAEGWSLLIGGTALLLVLLAVGGRLSAGPVALILTGTLIAAILLNAGYSGEPDEHDQESRLGRTP